MQGDRSKPETRFSRWIGYFLDGCFNTTSKGKIKVPSVSSKGKVYNKRWIRRKNKNIEQE